jgi:hypothetical protein
VHIPAELTVRATLDSLAGRPLPQLLVWFRLFADRKPYFNGVLGLTDSDGVVSISGVELRRQFEESQQSFPMDYKVPLDQTDDEIEVGLDGGTDYERAKRQAVKASFIGKANKDLWERAQNALVKTASVRRLLMRVPGSASTVGIVTTEA